MATTHRMTYTRVYKIWCEMRYRCDNPKFKQFQDYGGRGIKYCRSWSKFENFYADMGDPPTNDHSIERINNEGNYTPSNCKWATRIEQNNNKRNNRFITIGNKTLTLAQWSREVGVSAKVIDRRLRLGWPVEKLIQPVKTYWSRHEKES